MNVGFVDLVKSFDGARDLAADREGSDELGDDEWVLVKIRFVYECMNLLQLT